MNQDHLNKIFKYDPLAGVLYWRIDQGKMKAGQVAGATDSDGYIIVGLNYRRLKAHRIIWVMLHGEIPKGMQVDHEDQDTSNNRDENFRLVTDQCNKKNSSKQVNNKSDVTGVSWDSNAGKWRADIGVNKKNKYLGLFEDFDKATAARLAAERKYGFHVNHGKGA